MSDEAIKWQADADWIDHTDSPYERYLELKLARAVRQRDELLAACEAARQWLGPMAKSAEWGDYYSTLIALQMKLDAAIAAAKGES